MSLLHDIAVGGGGKFLYGDRLQPGETDGPNSLARQKYRVITFGENDLLGVIFQKHLVDFVQVVGIIMALVWKQRGTRLLCRGRRAIYFISVCIYLLTYLLIYLALGQLGFYLSFLFGSIHEAMV